MQEKDLYAEEERKEAIEYQNVLLDIRHILSSSQGKNLFRYLFKNLEVGGLPELGLDGSLLMDKLGSLRAGNSIYQLIAHADADVAGQILAEVEKEKHVALRSQRNNG